MQINLSYQAKTADEFKELALWLQENGVPANPTVAASKRDRGPNETRFLELSGLSKMRLTADEKASVESGAMTREQVAADKVLVLEAQKSNGETPVSEMTPKEAQVDDGEEFT